MSHKDDYFDGQYDHVAVKVLTDHLTRSVPATQTTDAYYEGRVRVLQAFLGRLLDPEDFGWAVTGEVRVSIKKILEETCIG